MNKQIYIINYLYYDKYGKNISVGGVETYIHNLVKVLNSIGYIVEVYQQAEKAFEINNGKEIVHGINLPSDRFVSGVLKLIPTKKIVVFANDENIYGEYKGITINLQHGIGWDFQKHKYRGAFFEKLFHLLIQKDTIRRIKISNKADYVVCVDYNYVNWYRTQVNHINPEFIVIPNFTSVPDSIPQKTKDALNIIFARRFVEYRGTRIFTDAIRKILLEYSNINVTFAGNGPDGDWIKDQLKEFKNVDYITYSCDESLEVHADKHIAVIPSIGSEGTSLSLLEAMASGCAVVCTNVGGMTNIVLDHFNGIMVPPESNQLYSAIKELIDDHVLREELAMNAYNTVSKAFSYDKWAQSWIQLINEIEERQRII